MQLRNLESSFVWFHRIVDLALPASLLYVLTSLYGIDWSAPYQNLAIFSGLLLFMTNQYVGIYHTWRGRSLFEGSRLLVKSWLMVWSILIVLAFMLKVSEQFSRFVLIAWFICAPAGLILYRYIIRTTLAKLYEGGVFVKNAAIYGHGDACEQLADLFRGNKWLGYNITGFYDETAAEKIIGGIDKLVADAKSGTFQTLYISLPLHKEQELKKILDLLSDTTVTVKYIPSLFDYDLLHASISNIAGLPVINIFDTPLSDPGKRMIKRLEDIVFSLVILVIISPVLAGIAVGIRFTSPGPVVFKQKRYGLNGEEFKVYKFRTMTTQDNGEVIQQASRGDPRVTRLGAFLRKSSLDELPQFINTLQGRMSIVGPRPHAVAHNEEYRTLIPKYMQRHLVKPGITGWAQINGWRGETDTIEKMQKRVEFDLYYINNWSLWLDIKIILLTVIKGFINKNAY